MSANTEKWMNGLIKSKYVALFVILFAFGFLFFGCTSVTYKVNKDGTLTVITYEKNPQKMYGSIVNNITTTCDNLNKQYNVGCMLKNGSYYAKKINKADWFNINIDQGEGDNVIYTATINKTNIADILPNTPQNYLKVNLNKKTLTQIIENSLQNNKDNITIEIQMPAKVVYANPKPVKIEDNKVYYTYAQIEKGVRVIAKHVNEGNIYLFYLLAAVGIVMVLFLIFSWYRAKERGEKLIRKSK